MMFSERDHSMRTGHIHVAVLPVCQVREISNMFTLEPMRWSGEGLAALQEVRRAARHWCMARAMHCH